jgi:hypothetical protein
VATGFFNDAKLLAHQDIQPAKTPLLLVFVREAEHVLSRERSCRVYAERLHQIFIHPSQHLVWLVHLHRALRQAEVIPQLRYTANVNPSDRRAPEVDRDAIWPLMTKGRGKTAGARAAGGCGCIRAYVFHCCSISSRFLPFVSGVNFQTNQRVQAHIKA